MSRAQIDKLGERLKAGPTTAADLRLLDEYRQTFRAAYAEVVTAVADLGFAPTGRPAKSTSAIIDKLRRESIRLTQIQDIAGCRIVVVDRLEQDAVAARLRERLVEVEIVDRRASPSHGYRAVHAIARPQGLPVEVQIRTVWQHHWAETSERLADEVGPGLKYGQGPPDLQRQMTDWSDAIGRWEIWLASRPTASKATLVEQTEAEREHQSVLAARRQALETLAAIRRRKD